MSALRTIGTRGTLGPMGDTHRVAIAPELFNEARRYMVEHGLPTVRSAVEAMIEAQSHKESGAPVIANTQEVAHCENGEAENATAEYERPLPRVLSHRFKNLVVPNGAPTRKETR